MTTHSRWSTRSLSLASLKRTRVKPFSNLNPTTLPFNPARDRKFLATRSIETLYLRLLITIVKANQLFYSSLKSYIGCSMTSGKWLMRSFSSSENDSDETHTIYPLTTHFLLISSLAPSFGTFEWLDELPQVTGDQGNNRSMNLKVQQNVAVNRSKSLYVLIQYVYCFIKQKCALWPKFTGICRF